MNLKPLLDNAILHPKFRVWPGGRTRHHTEEGGLLRHTMEVVQICAATGKVVAADPDVLIVAATWHDFGKIFQYEREGLAWRKTDKNHILCGEEAFTATAQKMGYPPKFVDAVRHCILSHHGRPEWGAVEVPSTLEAVILHQADMLSVVSDSGPKSWSEVK